MDASTISQPSLFQGGDGDTGRFLTGISLSVICHLLLVATLVFVSEYVPRRDEVLSVINVDMVSLPAPAVSEPGPAEAADPVPADPAPMAPDRMEELLLEQTPPEPEPTPVPEPEPAPVPEPTPEPAPEAPHVEDQVVIDPEPETPTPAPAEPKPEPVEPAPEAPEPSPAEPATPSASDRTPTKTPRYRKPSKQVIQSRVEKDRREAVDSAIEGIKRRVADREGAATGSEGSGASGFARQASLAIRSYKGSVLPDRINRNWAFSEQLASRRFNLKATVVITIRADGEITDVFFEKRSGDQYFDDSAYKAVIKSNPLPPLPRAYTAYEDSYTVGLRFTPEGLN